MLDLGKTDQFNIKMEMNIEIINARTDELFRTPVLIATVWNDKFKSDLEKIIAA